MGYMGWGVLSFNFGMLNKTNITETMNPSLYNLFNTMSNDKLVELFMEIPLKSTLLKEEKVNPKLYGKKNKEVFDFLEKVNNEFTVEVKKVMTGYSVESLFVKTGKGDIKLDNVRYPILLVKRTMTDESDIEEIEKPDSALKDGQTAKEFTRFIKEMQDQEDAGKKKPVAASTVSARSYGSNPSDTIKKMNKAIKYYSNKKQRKYTEAGIIHIRKLINESKQEESRLLLKKKKKKKKKKKPVFYKKKKKKKKKKS